MGRIHGERLHVRAPGLAEILENALTWNVDAVSLICSAGNDLQSFIQQRGTEMPMCVSRPRYPAEDLQ